MKKITLIGLFIFALVLSGCMNKKVGNIESTNCNCDKNQCIENYNCNCDQNECIGNNSCNGEHYKCIGNNSCNSDQNECIGEIYFSTYEGELVVEGVGPEISMEPTLEEGILALRGNFEDHTDHVFLRPGIWEDYFQSENEYLPGNTVKLVGKVQSLDGAAGNHYYVVEKVEKLEFIKYPTGEKIKDLLDSYNYCESDDDCAYIAGECPFGCYVPLNNNFADIAGKVMDNYFEVNGKSCVYSCLYMDKVVCENYKCEMVASDENGSNEVTDEHSNNTLIISMIEGTDQDMIDKYLLNKYDMEILYDYENFNTIAVKFDHEMTEEELDKTISEIEKVGFVIRVEKDYISHINN